MTHTTFKDYGKLPDEQLMVRIMILRAKEIEKGTLCIHDQSTSHPWCHLFVYWAQPGMTPEHYGWANNTQPTTKRIIIRAGEDLKVTSGFTPFWVLLYYTSVK